MPQQKLYQKTGLVFLLFYFSCASFSSTKPSPTLQRVQGYLGYFILTNHKTHIMLDGIIEKDSQKPKKLLWDTGSDISFVSENPFLGTFGPKELFFSSKPGILPAGFPGILGTDFFQDTCIWWEADHLYVFEKDSGFCSKPEAFLGIQLKFLRVKKKGNHWFVHFQSPIESGSLALVDTGASLSVFPESFFPGASRISERKVFLAGNRIVDSWEWESEGPLVFPVGEGPALQIFRFRFLSGISLEQMPFLWEKGKMNPSVIGLDILQRNSLFWDFSRNRIAISGSNEHGI